MKHGGPAPSSFKKVLSLLSIFAVVVVGGRYLTTQPQFGTLSPSRNSDATTASPSVPQNVQRNIAQPQAAITRAQMVSTQSVSVPVANSCINTVRAEIAAKKQDYAKGQILVTFNTDVDYSNAKDVLAIYGLVIKNEAESSDTFATRHYVTAAITPGEEIAKLCILRDDSHVKYATLDLYFGIHQ